MADRAKLTKRMVDALKAPSKGETRVWDDELSGFCVRIYPSGRKVYALKYRVGTRQRWHTIGEHGQPFKLDEGGNPLSLTAELARGEAEVARGAAREGRDVTREAHDRRTAITVAELIEAYLAEGPKSRPDKRASSWTADKGNLNHHVLPLLGKLRAREVTRDDIARMITAVTAGATAKPIVKTKLRGRARVRGGAGIAQRVKAATSAMFSWAVETDRLADNPVKGAVRLPRRANPERFLSRTEADVLLSKLQEMEGAGALPKSHGAIIRLLLLTGARKGEIAGLEWAEVDLDRKRLVLPPERTKAGGKTGERRVVLNAAAVEILKGLKGSRTAPTGLVFPAARGKGHTTGVQKSWEALRKAAGLPDVRLHDLRHTWASFAVASGASLYLVSKALGHANARTTERYAHLADDPLDDLAEAASAQIMGTPAGGADANA